MSAWRRIKNSWFTAEEEQQLSLFLHMNALHTWRGKSGENIPLQNDVCAEKYVNIIMKRKTINDDCSEELLLKNACNLCHVSVKKRGNKGDVRA